MYLKDVIYKQAVEGGGASSDEGEPAAARPQPRTYTQEQQDLKQAFLAAFEENVEGGGGGGEGGDGFGDGVLQQRPKKKKQRQAAASDGSSDEGEGEEAAGAGAGQDDEARVQQLLDGYFGRDAELSAEDKFLKRYILNKVRYGCSAARGLPGRLRQEAHSTVLLFSCFGGLPSTCPSACACGAAAGMGGGGG